MNDQQIAEIYQPLFNHMTDEYGIILTVTEMDEIIKLAQKVTEQYNNTIERSFERGCPVGIGTFHSFVAKDTYWKSCRHCGELRPLRP